MTQKWRKGSLDNPSLCSEIHPGGVGRKVFKMLDFVSIRG